MNVLKKWYVDQDARYKVKRDARLAKHTIKTDSGNHQTNSLTMLQKSQAKSKMLSEKHREQNAQLKLGTINGAIIPGAHKYLGGNPNLGKSREGPFAIDSEKLGITGFTYKIKRAIIYLKDIEKIIINSDNLSRSKAGAAKDYLFTSLAVSHANAQTAITVYTKDGNVAYYYIDGANYISVLAHVSPVLTAAKIPFSS